MFELKAAVAIHAAHPVDDEWERIVDDLANSIGSDAVHWRRALADRIFDVSVPRPDRVAHLLRRIRGGP